MTSQDHQGLSAGTSEQQRLLTLCHEMRRVKRQIAGWDRFTYCGIEDFLIRHGLWYEVSPWDNFVVKGAPRACFGNALLYALVFGWHYIEGLAIQRNLPLTIHHAWNIDNDGRLIDTTWRNEGSAYLGVEFSLGRTYDCIWTADGAVLDDLRIPNIYTQPWTGEDFAREWPKMAVAHRNVRELLSHVKE